MSNDANPRLVLWTEGDFDPFHGIDVPMIEKAGGTLRMVKVRDEEERARLASDAAVFLAGWMPMPRSFLERLDRAVGVIRTGIGVDTVDLAAATELGICVGNVPDFCLQEVAEHTLALIFAVARKIVLADQMVREGKWHRWSAQDMLPMHRVSGQTLGLIGLGNIGRTVARKARALGLKLVAYDPFVTPEAAASVDVRLAELGEVLSSADIVSLHVPLTPKTRHLINRETLGQMKRGAILINTSRGSVVDGKALLEALQSGQLAGAGLDVLEKEPQKGPHPFFELENVVLTCHYASCSLEAYANMGLQISQQASAMLRGEFPHHLVNQDVKDTPQLRLRKKM